jgi:hypothetical protein
MRGATAAGKLMALHRLFDKAGGLFLSLSLVARKPIHSRMTALRASCLFISSLLIM